MGTHYFSLPEEGQASSSLLDQSPVSISISSVINKTIKNSASSCTLIYSAFENNKSTSRQTWPDRGESEEVTRKMKEISPARTCLHPMRTPSRMDQLEDLLTPLLLGNFLSRPLSKLCRFKCPSSVQALPGWCVPAVRWTSPPGPPPSPA